MPAASYCVPAIFSTHVEMNRIQTGCRCLFENFLYARGDEPLLGHEIHVIADFLYARGDEPTCFNCRIVAPSIFSTHVEMNRNAGGRDVFLNDFLYARGDEPVKRQNNLVRG